MAITKQERQVLPAELAEIAAKLNVLQKRTAKTSAELDVLQKRMDEITARVTRRASIRLVRPA